MYIAYQNSGRIIEKVEFNTIEKDRENILNEFRNLFIDLNKDIDIDIDKFNLINSYNIQDNDIFYYFIYKYNNIIIIYQLDIESKHIVEVTNKCDINHIINNNELKWKKEDCNKNICTIM